MFDLDKYREIWQTIARNKVRSVLTGFGVLWGIFMYVVMMGLGNGIENRIMSAISNVTQNAVFIYSNVTSVDYKGFNSGRWWHITNDDMKLIKQNIPEIEYVSGLLEWMSDNPVTKGEKSGEYMINGIDNAYQKITPSPLIYGRYFNDIDMTECRKMCVIGERVYEELFNKGENPIGQRIAVDRVHYTVVGVVESGDVNLFGDAATTIFIPASTFQQVYNYGQEIDMMMVSAYGNVDIKLIEKQVKDVLKARHYIAPEDDMAVMSFNIKEFFTMFKYLFLGLDILIWIVGMGTMLAGVVGVSNIMLVSIRERTQEIGIRRALGAKPGVILTQIMSESTVLTFIAGFFGLFFGILTLSAIDTFTGQESQIFKDPYISFSLAIVASLIILISGAIAGIIPARSALRVKAIDAIRDE